MAPIPGVLHCWGGSWSWKEGGVGGRSFEGSSFNSAYPALSLIAINSIRVSSFEPVLRVTVFHRGNLLVLISAHEPLVKFSVPCLAAEGRERAAVVGA